MYPKTILRGVVVSMLALAALAPPADAVDGVVLINQSVAVSGGASPGDTPGFPVTLSQKGSYRLSSNLTLPNANTTGIEITTADVTLDLNGFAIIGSTLCVAPTGGGCLTNGDGVHADGVENVTVMNGTVLLMGRDGIHLVGPGNRVERVNARDNGRYGIRAGLAATVTGNRVIRNGEHGIVAAAGGVVKDNTARNNGGSGILTGGGTTVSGNTSSFNGDAGFAVALGSIVTGNAALSNTSFGLEFTDSGGGGYSQNAFTNNNGGNANPQVSGGVNGGQNVCGGDASCP